MNSNEFYSVAEDLDEYVNLEIVSESQALEIEAIIKEDRFAKYFFNKLKNSNWIIPLYKLNYLIQVPSPIESTADSGYYRFPAWYAGLYLKEYASKFPEIVQATALSLESENPRALNIMLQALLKIDSKHSVPVVDVIPEWLNSRFAYSMTVVQELGLLMEHLAIGGELDAAKAILDVLTKPNKVQETDFREEQKIVASSFFDSYWLEKALVENLQSLINLDANLVVSVLRDQLCSAIDLEVDTEPDEEIKQNRNLSYWRLNIRPDVNLHSKSDLKNMLVDALIRTLDELCEDDEETATVSTALEEFIDSDYAILRRIANHQLRKCGDKFVSILPQAYERHVNAPLAYGQSEFELMLQSQLGYMPENIQREVIENIYSYIETPEFIEFMNDRLENFSGQIIGETPEEKQQNFIEEIQFRELHKYEEHLKAEDREKYEQYATKFDTPPQREETGVITTTSWEESENRVVHDDIKELTIEEVIDLLIKNGPEPEKQISSQSEKQYSEAFRENVLHRPVLYSKKAELLINRDLSFIYHDRYFSGLEQGLKTDENLQLEMSELLALLEYIAEIDYQGDDTQNIFDNRLSSAKWMAISFLTQYLQTRTQNLEEDINNRVQNVIAQLIKQPDPRLSNEDENYKEPYNMRPSERALNSTQGVAVSCLVFYGLYCERIRKTKEGEESPSKMPEFIKESLEDLFNKEKYSSLAMHSVLGQYFPQLVYLDELWALAQIENIFPLNKDKALFWWAAWNAYVVYSDVYTNVFPALILNYRLATELLKNEDSSKHSVVERNLATHLMKAYILDMLQLGGEDGVLSTYFVNASDEIRSQGVFWLSNVVNNQKPEIDDPVWKRVWKLWHHRVEEASSVDDNDNYKKEIANYLRLLNNAPVDLELTYDLLAKTLPFLYRHGFEFSLMIEYLGRQCEQYPEKAVDLLLLLIKQNDDGPYTLRETKLGISQVFESAKSAGQATKDKVIEIVNIFGERGDYSWRHWLDEMK